MSERVTGFIVGLLIALGFAILISLLPASLFLETPKRVGVYVVCALAAAPTVWLLQGVASALLFAFVTAIIAGQVMLGTVAPALGR